MLLLGQWKHLKYSSYCQKILKFCLRDKLFYGQFKIVSEKQTAFHKKYFQRRKRKAFINYFFQNFWKTWKYWYKTVIIHYRIIAFCKQWSHFSNFELIRENVFSIDRLKISHWLKNWWWDMFDNIRRNLIIYRTFLSF